MKSKILRSILVVTLVLLGKGLIAQPPPPDDHGEDGDQQPAPIGSGIAILLALGAGYGAKKVYDARKKINE